MSSGLVMRETASWKRFKKTLMSFVTSKRAATRAASCGESSRRPATDALYAATPSQRAAACSARARAFPSPSSPTVSGMSGLPVGEGGCAWYKQEGSLE